MYTSLLLLRTLNYGNYGILMHDLYHQPQGPWGLGVGGSGLGFGLLVLVGSRVAATFNRIPAPEIHGLGLGFRV